MILMIDNYDSFTYNLVQLFQVIGENVHVWRNDQTELIEIARLGPSALIISPGPGAPEAAGISVEAIRCFGPKRPVLGVCLGHQSITVAFGGRVIRADRIMHGKISSIFHDGQTIYDGIPNPFEAIRYHSLIVDRDSFPDCLKISAWTADGEIMGLRHREYKIEGVQFHPESFLTGVWGHIIRNFIHNSKRRN